MLSDVLGPARGARPGRASLVVTADPEAARLAAAEGARVVPDHDPPRGMNAAVRRPRRGLARAGAEAALVLTADLPLRHAPRTSRRSLAPPPPAGPAVLAGPLARRDRHQRACCSRRPT